jgi:hypothetical protein
MKYRFISIVFLLVFAFIPIQIGLAYQHVDNVNEGISTFFLTSLNDGDNIELNLTHTGSGNFTLFLFDQRPINSFVKIDKTLDDEIFSLAINYSLDDNPYINYTALENKIYYIQVILLDNGPGTFFLYCNHELTRYYIPIIPGYQISLVVSSIIIVSTLIFLIIRKKSKKAKGILG